MFSAMLRLTTSFVNVFMLHLTTQSKLKARACLFQDPN